MPFEYNIPEWLTPEYVKNLPAVVELVVKAFSSREPPSKELIETYLQDRWPSDSYRAKYLEWWSGKTWASLTYDDLREVWYDWVYHSNPKSWPYILSVHLLASIVIYDKGRSVAEDGLHVDCLVEVLARGPAASQPDGLYSQMTPEELRATRAVLDLLALRSDEIGEMAVSAQPLWQGVS